MSERFGVRNIITLNAGPKTCCVSKAQLQSVQENHERMLFYKFQKPGNFEFNMLRRGEVYLASVAELNDASECRPRFVFKGSEELWQRLAQFVLDRVCFCSGFSQHHKRDEIHQVLDLSAAIGQRLKKKTRNRDLGIEHLCGAFLEALKHCGAEKLQPQLLQIVEHLASNFIEEGLPRVLLDEKYIASFALNATNPTMWGTMQTRKEAS